MAPPSRSGQAPHLVDHGLGLLGERRWADQPHLRLEIVPPARISILKRDPEVQPPRVGAVVVEPRGRYADAIAPAS